MSQTVSLGVANPPRIVAMTPALFAGAAFTGAALVFMVEPMMAKLVLPKLGGAPAVWNTSLAFFQAALLVGYAYAHVLQRIASVRVQTVIHGLVLAAAALVLPLKVTSLLGDPGSTPPTLWLLGVLALSVGPPFAALSATAPLTQAWYAVVRAKRPDAANPYVLYAASNLGSLLALLAYPIVVEPSLRLGTQTLSWSLGYGGFILMMGAVAATVWRFGKPPAIESGAVAAAATPTPWRLRLTWLALAAAPSSLMLGVTSYISMDIASAPFLWVAPLALYLLTFVIAFQAKPLIRRENALLFQAAAFVACLITTQLPIPAFLPQIGLHLAAFFLTALVCHQALVERRPAPERLTEFYLFMSLGGVIGGGFNAFLAPVLFKTVIEYPLIMALAGLARPWGKGLLSRGQTGLLLVGVAGAAAALVVGHFTGLGLTVKLLLCAPVVVAFLLRDRALALVGLALLLMWCGSRLSWREHVIETDRSFFGVVRVLQTEVPGLGPVHLMAHGTTLHGAQAFANPAYRCRPTVYYAPTTPIGQVFTTIQSERPSVRLGVIGMGAGATAAYTRPGDSLRFFEIDPIVVRIATDPTDFSFINGCAKGKIDWVLGDARLSLAREPANQFDVLLVDAFTSDAVPAHLMTVEAMRGYLARIKPDGVVIMHLSNRNLELMRPIAAVARAAGGVALEQSYTPPKAAVAYTDISEQAIIVARDRKTLEPFLRDPRWSAADSHGVRVWTDDYTNLFGALVRGIGRQVTKP